MFLPNSRYARVEKAEVPGPDGAPVQIVKLRRLTPTPGEAVAVTRLDRLDIMAQRRYGEPTWYWHIADANSELDARHLVERARTILVPEA